MRYGLIGSIILHMLVFGLVIFNFLSRKSDEPLPAVPVSVEIVAPKDVSERQAGKTDGTAQAPAPLAEVKAPEAQASAKKEVEQKPSPKPAEKEALVPPPPVAAPAPVTPPKPLEHEKVEPRAEKPVEKPVPKHVAKKEPPKKVKAKPEPVKKLDEPAPRHAEAQPDYQFDPSRIEANLHKDGSQASPMASQSSMEAKPSKVYSDRQTAVLNREPAAGAPAGNYDPSKPWRPASSLEHQAMGLPQAQGPMNAGSCADAVQSRIEQNWILPIGGQSAESTIIRLRIELRRDGTLLRPPAVMDQSSSPVYQAMADAAIRAAESGQPYNIPPQQYEQCRDMILRFNPRDMYGG